MARTLAGYLVAAGLDPHTRAILRRGQFHDVVLTRRAVYRFPRTAAARTQLPRVAAVLGALSALDLGPATPRPIAAVDTAAPLGRCHLATTRVPGVARQDPVGDPVPALAGLLAAMRHASGHPAIRPAVPLQDPQRWRDFAAQVRRILFPLMTTAGRRRAERELAAVMALAPATSGLVHGDLGGANLLWSDTGPELTGVVDWDSAVVGDQAADVASLAATYGWSVVRESVAVLDVDPEPLLARAHRIRGTFALQEALPAAIAGDRAHLEGGLAGYR